MGIRRATPADARGIAEIHVAAWQSAYRDLLPGAVLDHLSAEESAKRWEERIAGAWPHVFVAEEAERVVGFAACGSSHDEDLDREKVGEIYTIYVHPRAWRRGWGTALLSEALRALREEGFAEVVLWVLRGNRQAMTFYRAAGFEPDGASRVTQHRDGAELPLVRFRCRITEATTYVAQPAETAARRPGE